MPVSTVSAWLGVFLGRVSVALIIHSVVLSMRNTLRISILVWCELKTHWKRPWCWERLRAGGEGDDTGWDGWCHQLNGHESEETPGRTGRVCCRVRQTTATTGLWASRKLFLLFFTLNFLYLQHAKMARSSGPEQLLFLCCSPDINIFLTRKTSAVGKGLNC